MPDNNETTVDPWQEETKGFYTPGEQAAEAAPADEQPAAVDDKAAPVAGVDGDQDAAADAAALDPDAEAAAAIEGRSGDLPDWMKKRLERANKKESAAEQRARVAEEKAQQALDELAALKAGNNKPTAADPPDPDDFDTTAEYDTAKAAWTEAQKPKAKDDPKADATPKLNLPPGTSPEEYGGIEASLKMAITADTKAAILKMPVFTETMIVSIYDIADGDADEMENVAKFVADNADLMGEIAKMPLRRQQATIERAYSERVASASPKPKIDDAPPPISRNKARPAATGYSPDFSEFERQRNEEERNKGPF